MGPSHPSLHDPQRPAFHFLPEKNWLNDPNGLIQWQGVYHMFYQYNPGGPVHGNIHWGHARSADLVHWQHLPVALAPTPGGPDEGGCWSGCAVADGGQVTFLYTGFREGVQTSCLATAASELLSLEKYPANPVIAAPPEGAEVLGFRDHSIWREGQNWYMLIGSGVDGRGGLAFLYRSPDLRAWEYLHPLTSGEEHRNFPLFTGKIWECPSFFALDGGHALLVSAWDDDRLCYTAAFTGRYAGQRFEPQRLRMFDYGAGCYYAPQTMLDDQGRRLVWGWLQENRSKSAQVAAGWSGVMSLPRRLWLDGAGELHQVFVPELQVLRRQPVSLQDVSLVPGEVLPLPLAGDQLELYLELAPEMAPGTGLALAAGSSGTRLGLRLRCSPGGEEQTVLWVDWQSGPVPGGFTGQVPGDLSGQVPGGFTGRMTLDRSRSSADACVDASSCGGDLSCGLDGGVRLHLYLDHSVLEVIANQTAALASRIYPTRLDSTGLSLLVEGGAVRIRRLQAWQMASIWPS